MYRPFTMVSNDLAYDANVANFAFPTVPQGSARSAITGIRYMVSGTDAATALRDGWGSLLEKFTVAGRSYMQGVIPFPLIGASLFPISTSVPFAMPQFNRFLGSTFQLGNTYQGGAGILGAAIPLGPAEQVKMTVERLNTDSFVRRVVLDCIQWPDDKADPSLNAWKALRFQGIGAAYFVGSRNVGWPAAGATFTFDEIPQPPNAQQLRRVGFRAGMTDETGVPSIVENGATTARTMNNLLAQISTSFQRAPQNQAAPIRAIMGLPGLEIATGCVDMVQDEHSIASITSISSAIAAATRLIYVLHMFEGRGLGKVQLEAANAIS